MKRVESSQDRHEPQLTYEANGLWMEFDFSSDYLRAMSPAGGEPTTETGKKTSVKTLVKTSVKTADALLELFRQHPRMTLAEVAAEVGRTVRAVEMASAKLVKAGRLRFVGPQRGGHWEVLP